MLEVRDRLNFEDYLDSLLNSIESDDLEFKSAAGGFPGSFWDTYSASPIAKEELSCLE